MLIEQCAYGNRWRFVSPAAKALFCLGGLVAAFAASRAEAAANVALLAASMLANHNPALRQALAEFRRQQTEQVLAQPDPRLEV